MKLALAVLLMAVCSTSALPVSWFSYIGQKSNESFSIDVETKSKLLQELVFRELSPDWIMELNEHLGSTIYALILSRLDRYDSLPQYYVNALDNGVVCEMTKVNASQIKLIQYGSDSLTDEQREIEFAAAEKRWIGLDCSKNKSLPMDDCFCKEKNTLFYCAALNQKFISEYPRFIKLSMCEDELINVIEHKRVPEYHPAKIVRKYLDTEAIRQFAEQFVKPSGDIFADWGIADIMKIIENTEEMARFYCMARDPVAHQAVRSIFAANALRWTREAYLFEAVFNGTHNDIDAACAYSKEPSKYEFARSQVGRCACKSDTGLMFCIYKARAEYLHKIGFLSCNGDEMKLVNFKYPLSLPPHDCLFDSTAASSNDVCKDHRPFLELSEK